MAQTGKLPVPNFAAGGIATPADAALMMQLGAEAVFVGSGIFKSTDPAPRAKAIVRATTHWQDAKVVAEVSRGLGEAMPGLETATMPDAERLADPGLVMRPFGVLALQGDFAAHAQALRDSGVEVREVRRVAALDGLGGLVIPGGESTTLLNLMDDEPWFDALRRFHGTRRRRRRHLRRRDPARARGEARPAEPRPARRDDRAQRLRAGRSTRSRRGSRRRRSAARSTPSSSARRASARSRPRSRCWRATRASRCSCARGTSSRRPSTRS